MNPLSELRLHLTRRHLLQSGSCLLGTAALQSLLQESAVAGDDAGGLSAGLFPGQRPTHFPAKVRQVIYL
ncbi:MAG: sulfatase, partial [Planctomycetaceae bacterium]